MSYLPLYPRTDIAISAVYSVHYFEYAGNYSFSGEKHDFWELLYVDKGKVKVTADEKELILRQGEMIFHQPGEFHALSADGVAPDLMVVSFACQSEAMSFFRERIVRIDAHERALMGRIIEEGRAAFSTPLGHPDTKQLCRRENAAFGAEQLISAALAELLIRLVRRGGEQLQASRGEGHSAQFMEIYDYLDRHINHNLTVDAVCQDMLIGKSRLQALFHKEVGCGVMEYFGRMKIKAAQRMIREERMNFTEIAAALGFQSVHYFSRRFRFYVGMSPREYAVSVRMLAGPLVDDSANNV